ncbi:hypothetical protein ETA_19170 [Erwinia tasmaniensis Et1/99]|uniref:Uncharacterized protein n=1 Tax=Erwinia tasmaniensis (strain DSM 17950 / CFBP 7177 / CIP 109463 / NCPPB 4357 / Et1/99) TaxID=465817 RepID=B2VID7_ERWT9|nr:hypothetical protein ETA_19170 [Erwinia tasmaniensis Et1/99]
MFAEKMHSIMISHPPKEWKILSLRSISDSSLPGNDVCLLTIMDYVMAFHMVFTWYNNHPITN